MILKEKFREFMLLRSRNKDFRPHEYHGLEAVSSVAIAFESGPNDRLIHDFGQKLQALGKQVNYLGYVPKASQRIAKHSMVSSLYQK
ncbi:MAG: hypothetical protein U5L96_07785 [Owenweeksia sp.]|nr:hypothetical protein [Owenweeksia sp.]